MIDAITTTMTMTNAMPRTYIGKQQTMTFLMTKLLFGDLCYGAIRLISELDQLIKGPNKGA